MIPKKHPNYCFTALTHYSKTWEEFLRAYKLICLEGVAEDYLIAWTCMHSKVSPQMWQGHTLFLQAIALKKMERNTKKSA